MPLGQGAEELLGVGARASSGAERRVAVAASGEEEGGEGDREGQRAGKLAGARGSTRVVGGRGQVELRKGRQAAGGGAWRG
jgi:hypothetical protein